MEERERNSPMKGARERGDAEVGENRDAGRAAARFPREVRSSESDHDLT